MYDFKQLYQIIAIFSSSEEYHRTVKTTRFAVTANSIKLHKTLILKVCQ